MASGHRHHPPHDPAAAPEAVHTHDAGPVNGRELAARLREAGLRATGVRAAVLGALAQRPHATPEQVHADVCAALPHVALSSVYRSLESLQAAGFVSHVHLAGHRPAYQLVSHGPHAHLVCRVCGDVELLEPASAGRLVADAARQGFAADLAHLSVFGVCARCAARGDRPAEPAGVAAPTPYDLPRIEPAPGDAAGTQRDRESWEVGMDGQGARP